MFHAHALHQRSVIHLPKSHHFYLILGEGDINAVLIKTLAEAHANTNLKLDIVHEMFRKPQVRFSRYIYDK